MSLRAVVRPSGFAIRWRPDFLPEERGTSITIADNTHRIAARDCIGIGYEATADDKLVRVSGCFTLRLPPFGSTTEIRLKEPAGWLLLSERPSGRYYSILRHGTFSPPDLA